MRWLSALFALLLSTCVAQAQIGLPAGQAQLNPQIGAGCNGPLDLGFGTAVAAYSARKLRAAYAGKAFQLLRASDSTTQDIGFVGCNADTASATTFCAATTCTYNKRYDQTVNGCDATPPAGGSRPSYVASGLNSQPTAQWNAGTNTALQCTLGAGATSVTATVVAKSTDSTGGDFNVIYQLGNFDLAVSVSGSFLEYGTTFGGWAVESGDGTTGQDARKAVAINAFHQVISTVVASTSTSLFIDCAAGNTTGVARAITSSTKLTIGAGYNSTQPINGLIGSDAEIILWAPNLSDANAKSVGLNQQTYWSGSGC